MGKNIYDLSKRNFLWMGAVSALASLKFINPGGIANAMEKKQEDSKGTTSEIELVKKMAQRALDFQEVANIMARHSSYDAAGINREQLKEIWAINQPDVAFIQNEQMHVGFESINAWYCDKWDTMRKQRLQKLRKLYPEIPDDPKYDLAGWLKMHTNCTPNIQIAGDGKTAKGSWEAPGFVTDMGDDGKYDARWIWERFFTDFIKEDGKWKIWHFNALIQFQTSYGKSWVESSQTQGSGGPGGGGAPGGMPAGAQGNNGTLGGGDALPAGVGGMPGGGSPGGDNSRLSQENLRGQEYACNKVVGPAFENFPKQPEPYYTFSETFSYGPDMLEQRKALAKKTAAKK